jgi:hypothetical protein
MRMLVIKQDADLESLSSHLLSVRLGSSQAKSALESLRALNPHADFTKLSAGTVLLVPDEPTFKASASDSVPGKALADFEQLVHDGLNSATERLKAGKAARAAERADVTAVFKTAAVKRLLESDAELKQQVADATKGFKEDQQAAEQAEHALTVASKAASAALAAVRKVLG